VARYGVGDFSSFVSFKEGIACLTLSEKIASGWLHFLIPAGFWLEEFSCDSVQVNELVDHVGLRYVCKI